MKNQPEKKELSEYERYIISQNSSEGIQVNILSVGEIFQAYLSQMNLSETRKRMYAQQLMTLFFGTPFTVYIQMLGSQALLQAYMDGLELLFEH